MVEQLPPSPLTKILVVDDQKNIRQLVIELLKPLGALLYEAENGQDAIEKIIETEFDAVLLDIEMPIINGLTALRQLREVHGFKYVPIIMMTGIDKDSLITQAFNEGAYDYIRKPIHAEELLARVSSVIERRRTNREMFIARKQAEQASLAKSEFVSHLAHELNTPLNAIYGFAQLLELDNNLSEEQNDFIHKILKAALLQQELIRDSLDLARIEAGIIDIAIREVSLFEIMKEAFTMTHHLAEQYNVNIIKPKRKEADYYLDADPRRLLQILLNLLTNAIKYNKSGGEVSFDIISLPGERIRIGIKDTGIGIPENKMPYLFESFNRLGAENSSVTGYGLGLALSKQMLERMNGVMDVESRESIGSTFWMELSKHHAS